MSAEKYLENFTRRLLQDAMQEATAAYWQRRAATFRWVGTPAADETALACERRARLAELYPLDWSEVAT